MANGLITVLDFVGLALMFHTVDRLGGFGLRELDCGWETARTWGRLSADGKRRGHTHPINDTRLAASCLTEGLPLATLNVKDFADFADIHGLDLVR